MAVTLLTPTTTESPLGYRLMRKRPGNSLWERLNVITPGDAVVTSQRIPLNVLNALGGNAYLDISTPEDTEWPYDLLLASYWMEAFTEQNTMVFRGGYIFAAYGVMLLTRRGGNPGDWNRISNPDDRDLELEQRPWFSVGLLADTAVDPTMYDLHLDVKA